MGHYPSILPLIYPNIIYFTLQLFRQLIFTLFLSPPSYLIHLQINITLQLALACINRQSKTISLQKLTIKAVECTRINLLFKKCELGNSVILLKCVVTHEGQGLKLKNKKDEGFNIRMCGYFTKHPLRFHSCVVCAFTKNMSSGCHGKLEKPRLHSGSSYFVFAVITKNAACFCTHLVYMPSTFMSRTKVIITKFLLSKFSYV